MSYKYVRLDTRAVCIEPLKCAFENDNRKGFRFVREYSDWLVQNRECARIYIYGVCLGVPRLVTCVLFPSFFYIPA